jgi:hypothetical protein
MMSLRSSGNTCGLQADLRFSQSQRQIPQFPAFDRLSNFNSPNGQTATSGRKLPDDHTQSLIIFTRTSPNLIASLDSSLGFRFDLNHLSESSPLHYVGCPVVGELDCTKVLRSSSSNGFLPRPISVPSLHLEMMTEASLVFTSVGEPVPDATARELRRL